MASSWNRDNGTAAQRAARAARTAGMSEYRQEKAQAARAATSPPCAGPWLIRACSVCGQDGAQRFCCMDDPERPLCRDCRD